MNIVISLPQKWMAWLIVLSSVLLLFTSAHAAHYASCEYYSAGSSHVPRQVAELMEMRGDTTASACFDSGGKLGAYRPVTEVWESSAHICSYAVLPVVYPVKGKLNPDRYMTMSHPRGCPPAGDQAYVWSDRVPERVFVALIDFSERLCRNPKGDFQLFILHGASEAIPIAKQLESLCESLPEPGRTLREWLFSISADTSVSSVSSNGNPMYLMKFSGSGVKETAWSLWVNWEHGDVKVSKVQIETGWME